MTQPDIPWLVEGRKLIGMNERRDTDKLNAIWQDVKRGGYKNKPEISWCGGFVGAMLVRSGLDINLDIPNYKPEEDYVPESSQYWLRYGVKLGEPEYGCIVIFNWGGGKGHVGFCTGKTKTGSLIILGGNQNDGVNEKAFLTGKIVGYRWPEGSPYLPEKPLPIRDMATEHVRT